VYGFEPLETPAVENIETLLGKYGEEGNQLIFKILKRGEHEASGQADLALRYDLTVPLARVIAHHHAKLPRLFKRYQIQPVWRADRPARGRFREFYQCDVDAIGSQSPAVEVELCCAVTEVLLELGFKKFFVRLNHRMLLAGFLEKAGIPANLHGEALVAIDKLAKIGAAGVRQELLDRLIPAESADEILSFFTQLRSTYTDLDDFDAQYPDRQLPLDRLRELNLALYAHAAAFTMSNAVGGAGLDGLRTILEWSRQTRATEHLLLDFSLARGLSYYTGAIMEITVPDLAGSLGGGGRYDNLVGMFSGQDVPACGFSLGLERILVVMGERGMFPPSLARAAADVMVAVFDPADLSHAMVFAGTMRAEGLRVLVYPDPDKIGKQIKYADSLGVPFVALLGSNEIQAGTVTVKDLAAQTQQTLHQPAAGAQIRQALEVLKDRG